MVRTGLLAAMLFALTLPTLAQVGGDVEITAKVVLEDGSAMKSSPMVSLLVPGALDLCSARELFMGGTLRLVVPPRMIQGERQVGCHISITLGGYHTFTGYVQDGTLIKLLRIGPHEGVSVTAARLNVPAGAKKEYETGEAAAAKRKWPKAEEHFKAAVALYPQYAMALSELGQSLLEQGRFDEAAEALNKAVLADPSYAKAKVQLAAVSGIQQRWDDEMRESEEALRLNSIEFPAAYYYYAEAAYHSGRLEDAERFVRRALQLDQGATCPESLVLLGLIFEKQGNAKDATTEYKNYLEIAPKGTKVPLAKERIAELKGAN